MIQAISVLYHRFGSISYMVRKVKRMIRGAANSAAAGSDIGVDIVWSGPAGGDEGECAVFSIHIAGTGVSHGKSKPKRPES